ncbi:asparagine synthase (glutamine-hydrolyzing) [Aquincola tertiaricarbonis]|uniref:asparagine synthase (glutamine-hydrolyzing) n=1 Tax=Aquincola tertiaricarbonis TaxID=391953 RepID=A0ABY4S9W7_AQUTE|nr:asparagine synthase (glutamine-hydrolyzing) [Aquincola tertiaricarbonis]URI08831.1 asparagine synthase (glutamine-hydrolyzing) [Aquincola tertiaricarbonis]
MCGLAGVIADRTLTPAQQQRLADAVAALHHRGPDGHGIHQQGPVGLVHTRLAIIDLAGGDQPLQSAASGLQAVVNGEIYNHVELREEFRRRGEPEPRSHSDCEALLQAYQVHGVPGLARLNGMFAAALHDPARRRLVLARDRLGIKPLYYARGAGCVVFGSELRAVLALLGHTPPLVADGIAQFFEHEFQGGEATAFEGVMRVPPGHALVIEEDGLQIRRERYWSLAEAPLRTWPASTRAEEADEAFTALMEQVMTEHLRADVPFGLLLSGGVDSGLLCALLTRMHGQPIESFSVGYATDDAAEAGRNELDAAEAVAARLGTRHTALRLAPGDLWRRLPHAVWATDELMRDHAVLPTLALGERASQSLKIVFTGEGGDEVFAGYGRYRRPALQRWLAGLRSPGSGGFRTRSLWPRAWQQAVFGPALQAASGGFRQPQIEAWQATPRNWTTLQRSQHGDLMTAVPDNLLVKADRSLMAFGIEGRVPFLDHRVVEFGLSLPDAWKVQGRIGKHFLRRWGLRHLPHDALFTPKKGFHVPMHWLLSGDFLKHLQAALARNAAVQQWLQPAGVARLIEVQQQTGAHTEALSAVLHFALWHRIQVEQGGRRPPAHAELLDYLQ